MITNRGAEEHQYPHRKQTTRAGLRQCQGRKGYLRRSVKCPFALGMRENTRMTVTVRDELFDSVPPFLGFLRTILFGLMQTGRSRLLFLK